MKFVKVFFLSLLFSSVHPHFSIMAAETVVDFIRSPASLQYFVQESSFGGIGQIATERIMKDEKGITAFGTVVIQRVLFSKDTKLPLSIRFVRRMPNTPFVSDPRWGSIAYEKMNGLKVLAFASGTSQALQLIGLVQLDNAPATFIEDLTSIFQKRSFSDSDLTEETLKNHPVLASYALRSIFSKPDNWKVKLELVQRNFCFGHVIAGRGRDSQATLEENVCSNHVLRCTSASYH
jgi:hypothetical protein